MTDEFLNCTVSARLQGHLILFIFGPDGIWTSMVQHQPYPNGLNCVCLLILPSVIHSYCPYIDTDDLQQMTPVCI